MRRLMTGMRAFARMLLVTAAAMAATLALATLRISLESIAPMQPTRKVSTFVSLPG